MGSLQRLHLPTAKTSGKLGAVLKHPLAELIEVLDAGTLELLFEVVVVPRHLLGRGPVVPRLDVHLRGFTRLRFPTGQLIINEPTRQLK